MNSVGHIHNHESLFRDDSHPFRANCTMIRYLLLQNRQGKTRLSKWYIPVEFEEQARLENEIHKLVAARDSKVTNFIEFSTYKLITRRYADCSLQWPLTWKITSY